MQIGSRGMTEQLTDRWLVPNDADLNVPRCALMTDDPIEVLTFAANAVESGIGCALVTLTEIRGGAFRALGTQMAVRGDASYCGYVSGGCVEAAVAAEAVVAIKNRQDQILRLGEGSRYFDIVLPCGGSIALSIHVLRESRSIGRILAALHARRACALEYDARLQVLTFVDQALPTGWDGGRFLRTYRPKTRLVLGGRSIELERTATLACASGLDVLLSQDLDVGSSTATAIDCDTAVALLFHDLDHELPTLAAALAGKPFYIGALGSARTHQRRTERLRSLGYGEADIARVKAPIGLFGRARDANSLALSVLADIAVTRRLSSTAAEMTEAGSRAAATAMTNGAGL